MHDQLRGADHDTGSSVRGDRSDMSVAATHSGRIFAAGGSAVASYAAAKADVFGPVGVIRDLVPYDTPELTPADRADQQAQRRAHFARRRR